MDKYYTPPSDEIFEEIKREAIKIWKTYDNEYGYVDEKVGRIKNIANIKDNAMYIVAMFDIVNRYALLSNISKEAGVFINERTK